MAMSSSRPSVDGKDTAEQTHWHCKNAIKMNRSECGVCLRMLNAAGWMLCLQAIRSYGMAGDDELEAWHCLAVVLVFSFGSRFSFVLCDHRRMKGVWNAGAWVSAASLLRFANIIFVLPQTQHRQQREINEQEKKRISRLFAWNSFHVLANAVWATE